MKNIYVILILLILTNIIFAQDGSFDTTFDTDGQLVTDVNGNWDSCIDILVQSDDKIIAVGTSGNDLAVIRYDVDGNLDATFGTAGIKLISIAGSPYATKGILQSDEKIIIFGSLTSASPSELFLVRLNSDGNIDNTFGNNGIVQTNIGNDSQSAGGLKIQSDGKIIISGTTENYSPWNSDILLMRFNNDGSPDNTFADNGQLIINIDEVEGNPTLDYGIEILLQPGGKIIVIGNTDISGSKLVLIRLNSDGLVDTTFGTSGYVFDFFNTTYDLFTCAALQDDNKIIVGGESSYGGNNAFALIRFEANGAIDNSFGTSGKVMNTVDNFSAYAKDIVIQNDGKIVLVGSVIDNTFNYAIAIARYNAVGTLDTSFDSDGEKSFSFNSLFPPNDANAVALQSSGKILVGGGVYNNSDSDFGIARLNSSQAITQILLSLKVYLEGPYNTTNMNSAITVPFDSPHIEDPETVNPIPTLPGNEIVDWVLVQLRDENNSSTILESQSAYLLQDGSIVNLDGNTPVSFTQPTGNYYVVVKHRNHLYVMSAAPVPLTAN